MFFGEYSHQLDAKGRMRIPAKLRAELGGKYVITIGVNGCLFVMSKESFDSIIDKIKNVPVSDAAAQLAISNLFKMTIEVEEDAQGRFILPSFLKKSAKINKNVIIRGVLNRIEIYGEEQLTEEEIEANAGIWKDLNKYGI